MAKQGFPFDILWVADQCGLLSGKMRHSGNEVNIRCPDPSCGDKATHFAINTAKNTWNCPRCGSGGGLVALYATYRPEGPCDWTTATRELYAMWERGHGVTTEKKLEAARKRLEELKESAPSEVIAPIERRDAAYRALLGFLKLRDDHRQNLRERGLSHDDIERLGIKSLVSKGAIRVPDKIDTKDVAGFYTKGGHRFVNLDSQGILIPYQDLYGRIGMLEVRMFRGKRRYIRFTSGNHKDRTECTRSASTVHHVGIDLENPPTKVYLTEGGLKADVANALTGFPFIAVAGVNNPRGLAESLHELKAIGVKVIVMAFDMDLYTNPNVQKGMENAVNLIKEAGMKVKHLKWSTDYKGVDDYFLAKFQHQWFGGDQT